MLLAALVFILAISLIFNVLTYNRAKDLEQDHLFLTEQVFKERLAAYALERRLVGKEQNTVDINQTIM